MIWMDAEKYRTLDSYTKWCLQTYAQMLRAEKRAEKLRAECNEQIRGVPKEHLAAYIEITEEMEAKAED